MNPTRSIFCQLAVLPFVASIVGCASGGRTTSPAPQQGYSPYPSGASVALLGHPVHLGDNRATGQNWQSGPATASMHCSLVNMPRATEATLQVVNVRNTETVTDLLTVNQQRFPLGITLEQDAYRGVTPNAMTASPMFRVRLEAGPSQICLVAGVRLSGDVDDFEVDEVMLYTDPSLAGRIQVRHDLTLGAPPPSAPPSSPWGQQQRPAVAHSNCTILWGQWRCGQ